MTDHWTPPATLADFSPEEIVRHLERGDRFRVYRRLELEPFATPEPGYPVFKGVMLDLETTGTDTTAAEVIELGLVTFTFNAFGRVLSIDRPYSAFEEPSEPIPEEVVAITGITNAMVAGHVIPSTEVARLLDGADLIIAHHAEFDRPIAERRWPGLFDTLPWACSEKQINWKARGALDGKLGNVLAMMRLYFDGHRAGDDCAATVHALRHEWPENRTALFELLDTTRRGAFRVLAHDAPFATKDRLKARGYRWRGEKPWYKDFATKAEAEAEMFWCASDDGGQAAPELRRFSSRDRFSVREWAKPKPRRLSATDHGPYDCPDDGAEHERLAARDTGDHPEHTASALRLIDDADEGVQ